MTDAATFEWIATETLRERARTLRAQGYRLVQIGAARTPDRLELTYSFDRDRQLVNLRLHLPAEGARVPSLSAIYWCAFIYENEMHDLFQLQVNDMAVDFQGHFYKTAVKYPFGSTKMPPRTSASANAPAPQITIVRREKAAAVAAEKSNGTCA